MEAPEMYDLLILVDATASMGNYLNALRSSLPKIIALSILTSCFSRIWVLAYRDYGDADLLEWSGWMHPNEPQNGDITSAELLRKTELLRATGGDDYPEATKTGLAQMHMLMRKEATTVVLLYTDAPPHASAFTDWGRANTSRELEALEHEDSFGGDGPNFTDWVSACKFLHSSEKRLQIFSFLKHHMDEGLLSHYVYLSTVVHGATFYLEDTRPDKISHVTVEVLLSWMGVEKAGSDQTTKLPARMARYKSVEMLETIKDEEDASAGLFFLYKRKACVRTIQNNVAKTDVTAELLKHHLPKIKTPVQDFAQRYTKDSEYKKVVGKQLAWIIDTDVAAISLNPVFGSLWRAVCNDRGNALREDLTTAFGLQVDRIADANEKAQMKKWLEESYDYTAEVLETIAAIPAEKRFPCVLLDPTLSFEEVVKADDRDDETNRNVNDFRRDELLEIGRSCDYRVLRRLGRILTRLTIVHSAAELPSHIAATDDKQVPKIPLALAEKEHGRRFWKILLHIVVPGTMLSARPAALLGALAIKLGVQPLYEAADREMMIWRGRWNDLEIPETWNTNCLSLLLDADKAYRQRKGSNIETDSHESKNFESLLTDEDCKLFDRLVSYKLAEINLHTTLTARIGWTPEKTTMPIGPVVICKSCDFPRSVTIMARHGICGLCEASDYLSKEQKQQYVERRVTKEDTEVTNATWVECNLRTCRAQYVVYGVDQLRVKPKCYYCREQSHLPDSKRDDSLAPWLECHKCLNRVIWPKEYRLESATPFRCGACSDGRATIIDLETSADAVSNENGMDWLLRNQNETIEKPFNQRSLFHTISKAGIANFYSNVELFPVLPEGEASNLTIKGKLIQNIPELKSQLQTWIDRRSAEKLHCSLCFSTFRKDLLRPACGRSGCSQRICASCLTSWYGLNSSGHIINTAALACPFCRRAPSAKTLSAYGMGIHAVGNLKAAVEEKGEWIYAWCRECSQAKRLMERVCAAGAPPNMNDFTCETCFETSVAPESKTIKTRECPGCSTLTEKVSGCDHIECVVPSCGAHWCWACGYAFGEDEIYSHMNTAHGGYYGDLTDDEEDW